MPGKAKSLSKGGVFYLVYNVLNMAFPFLTGIYVARKLLPANIGEVAAAHNLATYFTIFAFLGIPTYGLREIAKTRENPSERNKLFTELFVINLISTIVFCVFYYTLIFFVPTYRSSFSLYAITGLSIVLNVFNISWLYEGLEEFQFVSIRNIIFKAVSFIFLIMLVRGPEDYLAYAAITIIGTAGNYIVNMVYSPRFASLTFKGLNLKRHMKSILFLVAVNLAIEIYSLVDITMMNFMSSKESIAYYKYGLSIYKMLLQVVNTFTMVLVPRISYYYKERKVDDFNLLVSKGLKLIIITAIPMIVGIYYTSDFLIQQMYGAQYANSATILKMFSLLLLVSPIGYLLGSRMLLVTDHESKMVICVGTGAIVNVIGNSIMIPIYHEYGATIASVISELVVMVTYVSYGRKYFKLINTKRTLIKVIFAAGIMGAFLFISSTLPISKWAILIIQIIGAVALYCSLLIVTNEEVSNQYFRIMVNKFRQKHRA